MGVDIRPAWMTPIVYEDRPPDPPDRGTLDDPPPDYDRRVDRDQVFGEELEENDDLYTAPAEDGGS